MNSTLAHAAKHDHKRLRGSLGLVLLVAAVAAAFLGAHRLVRGPRFVDRLTIRNPTHYIVDVSVTDEDGDGLVPVAALEPRTTTLIKDVIDPGNRWLVRFAIAGDDVGELRSTRAQLERRGWKITIPDAIVDKIPRRRS